MRRARRLALRREVPPARGRLPHRDPHLEEDRVHRRPELVELLTHLDLAALQAGRCRVVAERHVEHDPDRPADRVVDLPLLAHRVAEVPAPLEAVEAPLQDQAQLRQDLVLVHAQAHRRGAELQEGLLDLGAILKGRRSGPGRVHRERLQVDRRDRDDLGLRPADVLVDQRVQAVLRIEDGQLGPHQVRPAVRQPRLGTEDLVPQRVGVGPCLELLEDPLDRLGLADVLAVHGAGGVQAPVAAGHLQEVRLRLAHHLRLGDLAVEARQVEDALVVPDPSAGEQRLDDADGQRGRVLPLGDEVVRVAVLVEETLRDRDVGARDHLLAEAHFQLALVLDEAIVDRRDERASDALVHAVVLRLHVGVDVEGPLGLLDSRLADERHVREDLNLMRVLEGVDVEVVERHWPLRLRLREQRSPRLVMPGRKGRRPLGRGRGLGCGRRAFPGADALRLQVLKLAYEGRLVVVMGVVRAG